MNAAAGANDARDATRLRRRAVGELNCAVFFACGEGGLVDQQVRSARDVIPRPGPSARRREQIRV